MVACSVSDMENHPPPNGPYTANDRTAAFIRGKMAEQRKTATDLGARLDISRQAAGRRLSGETPLALEDLEAIAYWLGVPLRDLVQPGNGED